MAYIFSILQGKPYRILTGLILCCVFFPSLGQTGVSRENMGPKVGFPMEDLPVSIIHGGDQERLEVSPQDTFEPLELREGPVEGSIEIYALSEEGEYKVHTLSVDVDESGGIVYNLSTDGDEEIHSIYTTFVLGGSGNSQTSVNTENEGVTKQPIYVVSILDQNEDEKPQNLVNKVNGLFGGFFLFNNMFDGFQLSKIFANQNNPKDDRNNKGTVATDTDGGEITGVDPNDTLEGHKEIATTDGGETPVPSNALIDPETSRQDFNIGKIRLLLSTSLDKDGKFFNDTEAFLSRMDNKLKRQIYGWLLTAISLAGLNALALSSNLDISSKASITMLTIFAEIAPIIFLTFRIRAKSVLSSLKERVSGLLNQRKNLEAKLDHILLLMETDPLLASSSFDELNYITKLSIDESLELRRELHHVFRDIHYENSERIRRHPDGSSSYDFPVSTEYFLEKSVEFSISLNSRTNREAKKRDELIEKVNKLLPQPDNH